MSQSYSKNKVIIFRSEVENMNENELFEKAPIPKAYFTMALPVVFSMVVSLIYNVVDTYFIAKTQNASLVAAVSLCAPLFALMIALGDIFGIGGSSVLSRLFGQKENDMARNASGFCLYGSILCGIFVTCILFLFKNPILNFLGASQETIVYANQYYRYIALGSTFIIVSLTPSNLIRTEGLATSSMIGTIVGSVVNIILDPLFIFTLNMGAGGAALATILGYFFSDIVFLYLTKTKAKRLTLSIKEVKIPRKIIKDIFAIGIPASLTNIVASLGQTLMNRSLIVYGNENVAAMGIALKVNMIILLVMIGFAFGAQPLLGFNYGANNTERLKKLIKFDVMVELSFSIVTAIILAIFAPSIISLFMKDSEIISIGSRMLRWLILTGPCVGVVLVFTTLFQSEGKGIPALILSIARQGVIYALCLFIASKHFGLQGIIASQALSDVLTMCIAFILYRQSNHNSLHV